ncbi:MAG: tetratricopeptide repeat protein [Anaerolineae bacterium]|nr:tetratricopeptide repeat protein [Anaerolineae bacterium]
MSILALQIRLFGTLDLIWDGKPLVIPSSPTIQSLLAYLIFNHDHPITRDRLLGMFWPERSDPQARRALSNALWRIRQALGPAEVRLVAEPNTITFILDPQDELDVIAFASKVTSEPDQAIALYRADFMEACYDDWAILERERLNELYLETLERLANLQKQHGHYDRAIAYALRLVAADPLRETTHQDLMRLYRLVGRPQAALEQYAELRELLATELDVAPMPATAALYDEIKATLEQGDVSPPTPAHLLRDLSHLPFIGRNSERSALISALQSAAQSQGGVVLVRGAAGVGKSRLVEETIADAEWHGFQVGMGAAKPATMLMAYHALQVALAPLLTPMRVTQLSELLEPVWLNTVAAVFPPIVQHLEILPPPPLEPQEEQRRLWEGITQLLGALTAIAPVLLALEDAHWMDDATLAVLPHLVARLSTSRLVLILSYRPAEARERDSVWETLESLNRCLPRLRLELLPFAPSETAALLQRALGATGKESHVAAFAERLQCDTGGNAFLLIESLKSLLEQGSLSCPSPGNWDLPSADLPLLSRVPVRELVNGRLAHLPPPSRTVLELAAVLGEQTEFPVLLNMNMVEPATLLPALETLTRRGFLVESETHYRFGHDHIQETAYALIAPEQRQQMHRTAGAVLERLYPEQVENLALHYDQGHLWNKALHYHWQAGKRAAIASAYPVALQHYDRAVELVDAAGLPADQHFNLLNDRESVLDVLCRREEQADNLEMMTRLVSEGDASLHLAELYRRRARFLGQTSRYPEARESISLALTLADLEKDEVARAAALTVLGTVLTWSGRPDEAIPHFREAIELYQRLGDPEGEAEARDVLGEALLSTTSLEAAEQELKFALSLHRSLKNRVGEAKVLMNLGITLMERGDNETAITYYRSALDISREIGYRYNEILALGNLGSLFYCQGNAAQAINAYDTIIPLCEAIGERRVEAQARINRASMRFTLIGDVTPALADVEASLAYHHEAGDPVGEGQCLCVRGQIALQAGRLKEARADLEQGLAMLLGAGERWVAVQVYHFLIRLSLVEGRPEMAMHDVNEAQAICRELDLTDWAFNMLALRGLVLLAQGQPEAALAATREAVAHVTPGMAEAYQIFFWHYRVLVALGQKDQAYNAIREAYQCLSRVLKDFLPEERARSLEQVGEHRAIVAAWEASRPCQVGARLPHINAPIAGRTLRNDEWVNVVWTIAAPEDGEIADKVTRRRRQLLRLLHEAAEQSAAPTIEALSSALEVAPRTIKRDLAALRAQGHNVHTRGGR